jgi:hypothetical protein
MFYGTRLKDLKLLHDQQFNDVYPWDIYVGEVVEEHWKYWRKVKEVHRLVYMSHADFIWYFVGDPLPAPDILHHLLRDYRVRMMLENDGVA